MTEADLTKAVEALTQAQRHYDNDIAKYGTHHKEDCMSTNWKPVECKDDYASKGLA